MADSNINPYVAEIFKLANAVAPPLVASLQGKKNNTPSQLEAAFSQRMYDNSLNGSGPSDPTVAKASSPITILDQVTGREASNNPSASQSGGTNTNTLLLIAAAGLGAILLLRRR